MPCTKISLRASTDRRYIRSTYRSNRFILADITAPHMHEAETGVARRRPPVNLAFVLDRSGSMSGAKIALAKQAVEQSIGRLQADDRFSVVVYDDIIDVVVAINGGHVRGAPRSDPGDQPDRRTQPDKPG